MRMTAALKTDKSPMKTFCQIITTVGKRHDADKISSTLLKSRLVACVQVIGPVSSSYWWKGKIQKEKEFMILAKTSHKLYSQVERAIKSVHPYEVPEIIAMPITDVFGPYGRWIEDVIGPSPLKKR